MDEDAKREFERRKWTFLKDLDAAYKRLEEERGKQATEQLGPPALLDKWEIYLANVKATCEQAHTPDDLPSKIDRVSKLDKEIAENWPVASDLGEMLLAVEEQWSIFR